jgi:hypothetical protein
MVNTLDDVIQSLNSIVKRAEQEQARFGYFASLYLEMTKSVKLAIAGNQFEDNARMENLVVVFANRYLIAFDAWSINEKLSQSWNLAFSESTKDSISVIQHLLCGINAHVNLDLGIAAAQISPGNKINQLQNDFNTINSIIGGLVDGVQQKLENISLPMRWLDRIGKNHDEQIANFSMKMARNGAWNVALDLAKLPEDQHANYIEKLDRKTCKFGHIIIKPGWLANLILKPVKWFEPSNPAEIIKILNA